MASYVYVCPKCKTKAYPHKGTSNKCPKDGTLMEKRCPHCGNRWPSECTCN